MNFFNERYRVFREGAQVYVAEVEDNLFQLVCAVHQPDLTESAPGYCSDIKDAVGNNEDGEVWMALARDREICQIRVPMVPEKGIEIYASCVLWVDDKLRAHLDWVARPGPDPMNAGLGLGRIFEGDGAKTFGSMVYNSFGQVEVSPRCECTMHDLVRENLLQKHIRSSSKWNFVERWRLHYNKMCNECYQSTSNLDYASLIPVDSGRGFPRPQQVQSGYNFRTMTPSSAPKENMTLFYNGSDNIYYDEDGNRYTYADVVRMAQHDLPRLSDRG